MHDIVAALETLRPPAVLDEADLADLVAACLAQHDIAYQREYKLGRGCRADFMLEDGLLIEVKAMQKASKQIREQLSRYAVFDEVQGLILVTNMPLSMPLSLQGKPLATLYLKRLWGVAL